MNFIRTVLRLFLIMLFSALGASMAFAVPMTTSEISFYQAENTLMTQAKDVGFAARAPPIAMSNVAATGGVNVMHGGAFVLHGQETVAALFGFDADHVATNNVRPPVPNPTAQQLAKADELGVDARWIKPNGSIDWPTAQNNRFDDGFDGPPAITELQPGARFDRYGGEFVDGQFVDRGDFVSPSGVPFEQRALPSSAANRPYQEYEVLQPIPNVNSGSAAPWFGQPGGGTQYQMPMSINELVRQGFIRPIFD
jgi:hypothetical protein